MFSYGPNIVLTVLCQLTRSIRNWSLKSVSANVKVAAHVMFARSSCVTRSLTANECTSSFCENVVIVSQRNRRMNAIRAKLCDESGATVRKKNGNSRRSLSAGDVEPKETYFTNIYIYIYGKTKNELKWKIKLKSMLAKIHCCPRNAKHIHEMGLRAMS